MTRYDAELADVVALVDAGRRGGADLDRIMTAPCCDAGRRIVEEDTHALQ